MTDSLGRIPSPNEQIAGLPLLEVPVRALARASDGETSKAAALDEADSGRIAHQEDLIEAELLKAGPRGLTGRELAARLGWTSVQVMRRMSRLRTYARAALVLHGQPPVPFKRSVNEQKEEVIHVHPKFLEAAAKVLEAEQSIHFVRRDGTSGRARFPSCVVIYRPAPTGEAQLGNLPNVSESRTND